jgi:hypothetical protein
MAPTKAAVLGGGELHRILRQAGRAQPVAQAADDGAGGMRAFAAAAQEDGAAGLEAERPGIGGDVRAAFEDHADHAERLRHAPDHEAVRPCPFGQHAAHRIGQGSDVLQPARHCLHARGRQHQPVAEGGGQPRRGGEVGRVGVEDRGLARAQGGGGGVQRGILRGGRGTGEGGRGGPRGGAGGFDQMGVGIGRLVHRGGLLDGAPVIPSGAAAVQRA